LVAKGVLVAIADSSSTCARCRRSLHASRGAREPPRLDARPEAPGPSLEVICPECHDSHRGFQPRAPAREESVQLLWHCGGHEGLGAGAAPLWVFGRCKQLPFRPTERRRGTARLEPAIRAITLALTPLSLSSDRLARHRRAGAVILTAQAASRAIAPAFAIPVESVRPGPGVGHTGHQSGSTIREADTGRCLIGRARYDPPVCR
jgi:hypothetical protein